MNPAGVLPCLLVFHPFKELSLLKPFKLRLLSLEPCSFPKASAKVELFTLRTKYFNNFFREIFQEITHYSDLQRNKIARFFQPQRPFSRIKQNKAQKRANYYRTKPKCSYINSIRGQQNIAQNFNYLYEFSYIPYIEWVSFL